MTIPMVVAGLATLILVVFILQSPGFRGRAGERRVHRYLRANLDRDTYHLFKDLMLFTPHGSAQIDHVVVSRFGVFVIETKNMSGWIFGTADQTMWTQVIYRHKSRFQNPIRQNYGHVRAVETLLHLPARKVHNLVAFVGSAAPKTGSPPNVAWSVRDLTAHIASQRLPMLADDEVQQIVARLSQPDLQTTTAARKSHIRQVRQKTRERNLAPAGCPRCGADMVARTNRQSGAPFLACTRYPNCKGTRTMR